MRKSTSLIILGLSLATAILVSCDRGNLPSVTVYKTSTCGCCNKWVSHIRNAGFEVTAVDVDSLPRLKAENGIPQQLSSCHTALIDGYVVEGHVPAADILRLLEERPRVVGLTAPGMPLGSPGMEVQHPETYVVYTFDANGKTSHFASHGP